MTVQELYNQRKQEYQQYQIDKGIYEDKLRTAEAELKTAINTFISSLSTLEDSRTREILEPLATLVSSEAFSVPEAIDAFDKASALLTEKVKEVLQ